MKSSLIKMFLILASPIILGQAALAQNLPFPAKEQLAELKMENYCSILIL
jgi:hypothetical protein